MLFGIGVVWIGSLGNILGSDGGLFKKSLGLKFISIAVLFLIGFLSLQVRVNDGATSEIYWYLQIVAFASIGTVIIQYLCSIPTQNRTSARGVQEAEMSMENAAYAKVESMVANALDLHENVVEQMQEKRINTNAAVSHLLSRFQALTLNDAKEDDASSFVPCWKQCLSGDLQTRHGVLLSARFLAINTVQVIVSVLIVVIGVKLTRYAVSVEKSENFVATLVTNTLAYFGYTIDKIGAILCRNSNNFVESVAVLSGSAINEHTCEVASQVVLNAMLERVSITLSPVNKSMITIPLLAATCIGTLYTFFLSVIFIPSIVSTTMKFRSGAIPLFDSMNHFQVYRERMDRPYELLGTMLWVSVVGPALFGAFWGLIMFLFLWQVTREAMKRIVASVLGICVTFGIRWVFGLFFVDATFAGFYRTRVSQSNIGGLLVECVMVGFGVALAIFRALVCVSISLMYIARADRKLFASDITIGFGHQLLRTRDHLPVSFRKEILIQEAHHHPFIETLGKVYLTKLLHREHFANRQGSCMRLLFTLALMPWLQRYRDMARGNKMPAAAAWLNLRNVHLDLEETGQSLSSE